MTNELLSPCVRNCCLDKDDYCLGCNRHLSEITYWREYSETERRDILMRCEKRGELRNKARASQIVEFTKFTN